MSKHGYIYVHPLAYERELDAAWAKHQKGTGTEPLLNIAGDIIRCHLCDDPAVTFLGAYTDQSRNGFVCKFHFNDPYGERTGNRLVDGVVSIGSTE